MRRGLGEAIGVTNAVVAVLDWQTDDLQVLAADELLPTGTLADGERAVPAHVTFDTEDGLIVAIHTLPARTPGLSGASTGRRRSGTCPRLARPRAASRPTRSARTCRG